MWGSDQEAVGPGRPRTGRQLPGRWLRARRDDARDGRAGRARRPRAGVDADPALGAMTLAMLHGAGHRQCAFHTQDLAAAGPIPGAPFDLVYARLLLFHLPQRVDVLSRLWGRGRPRGAPAGSGLRPAQREHAARARLGRRAVPGDHRRVRGGGRRRVGRSPASAAVRAGGRRCAGRHRRGWPHRAARHWPRHHGGHLAQPAADRTGPRRHHRAPRDSGAGGDRARTPPGSPTIRCCGRC